MRAMIIQAKTFIQRQVVRKTSFLTNFTLKLNSHQFFHKDVYSYGMLLYEMFNFRIPFQEYRKQQVENLFCSSSALDIEEAISKLSKDFSADTPPFIISIFKECVRFQKTLRTNFENVTIFYLNLQKKMIQF